MKTKVKICGIRNLEAANVSMRAGADFLGFNLVSSSKRYIEPKAVREIVEKLPREIKIVGVFQNESMEDMKELIDFLKLDFVQLHGSESYDYSALTQYAGVIKVLKFYQNNKFSDIEKEMKMYDVDYFLLDRPVQGEGAMVNLGMAAEISRKYKIFFAGGVSVENVGAIIERVRPYAVDVAGGVESEGEMDLEKIQSFIEKVKGEV